MRFLVALLWLVPAALFSTCAQAGFICPYITIGWATQWQTGRLQSASYDTAAKVLYVVQFDQTVTAFSNVPLGMFQALTNTHDPYSFYSANILPRFPRILLTEKDNCPILQENGDYVWLG